MDAQWLIFGLSAVPYMGDAQQMYIRETAPQDPSYRFGASPPQYQDSYSGGYRPPSLLPLVSYANGQSYHKPNNPPTLDNKSFLDGFDNNTSSLSQEKSHKRNIKGMFNNQDPAQERAKDEKMKAYRDELQRQMEEVKERKRIEKEKIEAEQLQRERKFYDEFKIQAQQSGKDGKDNGAEHLTMMRTVHHYRKKPDNKLADIKNPVDTAPSPKNYKRGGYHNQSSLDNFEQPEKSPEASRAQQFVKPGRVPVPYSRLDEQIAREKSINDQRISKLLIFQKRVLQKISDIKQQIRNTSQIIDTDKQLARVRDSLRARRSHLDDPLDKSSVSHRGNASINNFYSLPRRIDPIQRYTVKLQDKNSRKKKGQIFLQSFQVENDKNLRGEEELNEQASP